jgi:hypothetical protein
MLAKGDQLWATWRAYWPHGYDWTAMNGTQFGWLKFFRLNFVETSSASAGAIILNLARRGVQDPYILEGVSNVDSTPNYAAFFGSPATAPVWDAWEKYTLHAVLDDVAEDSGGFGRVDVWRDGVLLLSLTSEPVLPSADARLESVEFFGFWNGGAPRTQSAYVESVRLSSVGPPGGGGGSCGLLGVEVLFGLLARRLARGRRDCVARLGPRIVGVATRSGLQSNSEVARDFHGAARSSDRYRAQ